MEILKYKQRIDAVLLKPMNSLWSVFKLQGLEQARAQDLWKSSITTGL